MFPFPSISDIVLVRQQSLLGKFVTLKNELEKLLTDEVLGGVPEARPTTDGEAPVDATQELAHEDDDLDSVEEKRRQAALTPIVFTIDVAELSVWGCFLLNLCTIGLLRPTLLLPDCVNADLTFLMELNIARVLFSNENTSAYDPNIKVNIRCISLS